MPQAPHAIQLTPEELGPDFQIQDVGFCTTAELPPLSDIVGQPRALQAFELGLEIRQPGYHIYLAGVTGSGRMEMVHKVLQDRAAHEPAPFDWLYVNNFDGPDQPLILSLPAGQGAQLQRDMSTLVNRLLDELPKAFQREDFSREKDRLRQQYHQQSDVAFALLEEEAKKRNFSAQQINEGQILFAPLRDGRPIPEEDLDKLTPEEIKDIDQRQRELLEFTETMGQRQMEIERQLDAEVRQVEREFANRVIEPLVTEIAERYGNEKVSRWLDRLKAHFLKNLDRFRRRADRMQVPALDAMLGEAWQVDIQERFFEYQVNLLVCNKDSPQTLVVHEPAPTYKNLFGTIDRVVDRFGRVVTNFTRIKPGSLHRANGGYLVFNLEDALTEPFVWRQLKRTIKSGLAEFEAYDPYSLFTVSALKPEPVPLDVKLIVLGHPLLYHLLYLYDDDFRDIFRIKADFDTEFTLDRGVVRLYGSLVRRLSDTEGVAPFEAAAVAEIARASSRIAADQRKLTAEFRRIIDVIREAAVWARREQVPIVATRHVRKALEQQIYRSDLLASKMRSMIEDGTLLISLGPPQVGEINGLTVADLGACAFGWPVRLTASAGIGTLGVVNIEHESRLSGRTYDKAMLILEGYLRSQYAQRHALALSASITLEQSYGGVDGDSASAAELIALLSALANIPLRQDIAVTGSINQRGQLQAIGGVNEKIEGFYDICRQQGLTGQSGVCIPRANVKNLVLRHDVVESITAGQFHVWSAEDVDQVIELLTGIPAGEVTDLETFHGRVDRRLREMLAALKPQRRTQRERSLSIEPQAPPTQPPDPRPPLPGRGMD